LSRVKEGKPLKISGELRINPQQFLFDTKKIKTLGHARYVVGDVCEKVIAERTGATRLRTDSTADYCPDLKVSETQYLESKASGNTKRVIVYIHRLWCDRRFVDAHNVNLDYWVCQHDVKIEKLIHQVDSIDEFEEVVRQALYRIVVVPLPKLETLLLNTPTRRLNTRCIKTGPNEGMILGYGKSGYGVGWDVPVKDLIPYSSDVINLKDLPK
jgi:hypothetical protein